MMYLQVRCAPVIYPRSGQYSYRFGDHGKFISDSGYVTIFVKYGVFGLIILIYALVMIGVKGFQLNRKITSSIMDKNNYFPISIILPVLVVIFLVGPVKGGLYFITYKTGEFFAFILAICVIESEFFVLRGRHHNDRSSSKISRGIIGVRAFDAQSWFQWIILNCCFLIKVFILY